MLGLSEGFSPGVRPPVNQPAYWFGFIAQRLLVTAGSTARIPLAEQPPFTVDEATETIFLGELQGTPCFAVAVTQEAPGWSVVGLREAYQLLPADLCGVAGVAVQLLDWQRSHRYCGVCATPMVRATEDRAMHCRACGHRCYPRVAPAVMVRVIRDRAILLARSPRFAEGVYSVLAGFVEPGETLEQTIHREVYEEVGVRVHRLHYLASQSWPFPHSLMIAFGAEYLSGEICVDGEEIEAAEWFTPQRLPQLPGKISIARYLIDDYLQHYPG